MSAMESKPRGAQRRHVVVLGGGIQGASAAYFLSKRDAKVTVVELESVGSAASGKVRCSLGHVSRISYPLRPPLLQF